jgi:hypothetical protein
VVRVVDEILTSPKITTTGTMIYVTCGDKEFVFCMHYLTLSARFAYAKSGKASEFLLQVDLLRTLNQKPDVVFKVFCKHENQETVEFDFSYV